MKKKVCMHSDVYFRTNKKTGKVYTGKLCNPSTKEPSAAQTAAKARFAKMSAQVAQRKKNLATMNQDREAFEAQKNTPGGKKTLTSYLWMVVGAAYDAEHPGE